MYINIGLSIGNISVYTEIQVFHEQAQPNLRNSKGLPADDALHHRVRHVGGSKVRYGDGVQHRAEAVSP